MNQLLQVDQLSGGYNTQVVIRNVSFTIDRGEFVGIIGPNGSGKSTLLKLINRVLNPFKGSIRYENRDVGEIKLKEFCQSVAFVSQDTQISFSYSVWEIVLMGRIPHLNRLQLESKKDYDIARQSLKLTDTEYLINKKIDCLSAGEKQRVLIAKALSQEPVLLLLDEPTSHLDIRHQIQILDLLKKLNRDTRLTIIIVLHDLNLASEYCGRLMLLNDGTIFTEGSPESVLTYQNIEKIYKTVVLVNKNPLSSKPFVIAVSGEK